MQTDKILVLSNGRVEQFGPRSDVLRRLVPPHRQEPAPLQPAATIAAEPRTAS